MSYWYNDDLCSEDILRSCFAHCASDIRFQLDEFIKGEDEEIVFHINSRKLVIKKTERVLSCTFDECNRKRWRDSMLCKGHHYYRSKAKDDMLKWDC